MLDKIVKNTRFGKGIHNSKISRVGKKGVKILFAGCLVLVILIIILIVAAITLAFNYHTQIYDGFVKVINFIFGDSPDNVIGGYLRQICDGFVKSLFNQN